MLEFFMKLHQFFVPENIKPKLKEAFYFFDYMSKNLLRKIDIFSQIEIETNSNCNRKCRICPRFNNEREIGFMEGSLFLRILEQLKSFGFSGRVSPVFYNEPMLDERIFYFISKTKEILPKSKVMIYSNGSIFTKESLEKLFYSGADFLTVSQYSGNLSKDKDVFIEAFSNLDPKHKKKIRHRILTEKSALSRRGGLVKVQNPTIKKYCFQSAVNCVVDFKGDVILCCNDFFAENSFGNVANENILDIWNKENFVELRTRLQGGFFDLNICKFCAGINTAV